MVSQVNAYQYNLSNIYNTNNADLGLTLQRIASGKKFQTPSDDVTNYFRTKDLDNQYSQYETIKSNLTEWQGALNTASTAGGEVYNKLSRMKDLSSMYASADAATQSTYTTEYNQLKADVNQITSLTKYGSVGLMNTASGTSLVKLDLVPNATADSQRLLVDTGEAVTAAHLTALDIPGAGNIGTLGANIDTAISDIKTYTTAVSSFQSAITSHTNIADSVMSNTKSVSSLLSNIDDAQEIMTYTQQEIRQQASIAMLTQANLSQRNVLSLYQFGR